MHEDQIAILIKKYLDGNCSDEEQLKLEQWYEAQDNDRNGFYNDQPELKTSSSEKSLAIILQKINRNNNYLSVKKRLISWKHLQRIAAVSFVIGIFAALLWNQQRSPVTSYEQITAGPGSVVKLRLKDNSLVYLNPGSKLKYPKYNNGKTREVYLEGEAYFDVVHDEKRPFKVHTSKLTTTVLGTAFTVMAYQNGKKQSVTVIRGKVQVADDKTVLGLLTPDKRIDYNVKTKKSILFNTDAASVMSWKQGSLHFENEEMDEIAATLGRWYGYEFKFNNEKIKWCRYTASFNGSKSITEVLEVIKAISKISYKIDNTKHIINLDGKDCNY